MNRDSALLIVIGLAVVAAIAILGLGALGTTTMTSSSGGAVAFDGPPADGSSGVVFDLIEHPGQSLFGIDLTSSSHEAHIGMVVPDDCVARDADGREYLLRDGVCGDLPVYGEITGGGSTITGGRLVIVGVDITSDCFEALEIGDSWPGTAETCSEEE